MTALTLNSAGPLRVAGVYRDRGLRAPDAPWARTDVAGFVGFEPVGQSVLPRANARDPVCCDDWRDYVSVFGELKADGTLLGPAVRAFFVNGGRRCYVVTVARPDFNDPLSLEEARDALLGVAGSSQIDATGFERLQLIEEISLVDVPDLYARRAEQTHQIERLPGLARESAFLPCDKVLGSAGVVDALGPLELSDPLFSSNEVVDFQKRLIARSIPERWRLMLLLSPPMTRGSRGVFEPPSPDDVMNWRDQFDHAIKNEGLGEIQEVSCAVLYYPWVLTQERLGAPIQILPPSCVAAGVIARRDLARGAFVAPANETVRGAVGLSWPLDDDTHGILNEPDADASGQPVPSVNLFRAFPGYGIQLWGARTLSTDRWLRFLSVRRGLSAIQRRCKTALEAIAFEPNSPILWLQVGQIVSSVLMPVYLAGGMRGATPEEAFYIRCDSSVNPPESVEQGRLVCEVGVALAASAEYIVFRVGRQEGVIEVVE